MQRPPTVGGDRSERLDVAFLGGLGADRRPVDEVRGPSLVQRAPGLPGVLDVDPVPEQQIVGIELQLGDVASGVLAAAPLPLIERVGPISAQQHEPGRAQRGEVFGLVRSRAGGTRRRCLGEALGAAVHVDGGQRPPTAAVVTARPPRTREVGHPPDDGVGGGREEPPRRALEAGPRRHGQLAEPGALDLDLGGRPDGDAIELGDRDSQLHDQAEGAQHGRVLAQVGQHGVEPELAAAAGGRQRGRCDGRFGERVDRGADGRHRVGRRRPARPGHLLRRVGVPAVDPLGAIDGGALDVGGRIGRRRHRHDLHADAAAEDAVPHLGLGLVEARVVDRPGGVRRVRADEHLEPQVRQLGRPIGHRRVGDEPAVVQSRDDQQPHHDVGRRPAPTHPAGYGDQSDLTHRRSPRPAKAAR